MSTPATQTTDVLAETGPLAGTGTDWGDTRCARIPKSASAAGACPPASVEGACLPASVRYDERGLVPCVVQDWDSGEVLMLAYMNEEALQRTRATGELHLWSRSRGELWHKGATSGNTQAVRALRLDCDGDTLLALVQPAGPACHTGERTCFHRGERSEGARQPLAPHETLPALERTLAERARERPVGSYTVALLEDPPRIGEKVREEAEEVARAAREETAERVDEEAADVLYHLLVLLHSRGRALADAERVLDARRG
jgi:phosphoribosyl-ATP pyrophosphohydrolase/phosphoribosyl-AMP cyclohydrolase